jgi:aspartyl-tRNA(Asn)/glutamyl-tRNA(Gln) amidotransferase subunit A
VAIHTSSRLEELAFAPIPVLAAKLRSGDVTAVEIAQFHLARLERLGPKLNAVVTITRERALVEAKAADDELKSGKDRGPLHGIPYGAKDLLATRSIPTTWGAEPFRDRVIDRDATVVRRLREAGAVLCAKLAMVELAGGMGYRQPNASLSGPGLNPWDPKRWSGGSSSGSGAAVAAGLVPFAIGTETWGSITTPASFCGVTGLRPTYGRVSAHGAMALAWTHDKIGPIARTAHDCGVVLSAIAGHDPDDPASTERPYRFPPADSPQRPWKLAIIKNGVQNAQADVKTHFDRALAVFREMGASIDEVDPPEGPFAAVAATIISAEGAAAFEELHDSGEVAKLTAPEDRVGGFADQTMLATEYIRAQRIRAILARRWDTFLEPFDAILTVPTGGTATPADGSFASAFRTRSIGAEGNLCGTPAIVVPTGIARDGLPTALQIDGRAYSENRILALAIQFQQATAWHLDHPKIE